MLLRTIIKFVATICHILKLKCTKFDFGWGSTHTPLESLHYNAPQTLSWISAGLLLREGRDKDERRERRKGEEERMGGKGKEEEGHRKGMGE